MEQAGGALRNTGWKTRIVISALIFAFAVMALWSPKTGLLLRIDSSPEALEARPPEAEFPMVAALVLDRAPDTADLAQLADLERQLRQIPGVLNTRSAATLQLPLAEGDEIMLQSVLDRIELQPERAEQLWNSTWQDPFIHKRLVDESGRVLGIVIEGFGEHAAARTALSDTVEDLLSRNWTQPGQTWHFASAPKVSVAISSLLLEHLGWVLPMIMVLFCAMLLIAFRSVFLAVAGLICVVAAVTWTLALSSALHWALNLVTIVVIPLVMVLCVAYVLHVISEYAEIGELGESLRQLATPFALTVTTTVAGLLALAITDMFVIRQFAILGAGGTIMAALSAWILMPALLALRGRPPKTPAHLDAILVGLAQWISPRVTAHSQRVLRGAVLLLLICALGATQVHPGTKFVHDLPEDNPARQDFDFIAESLGSGSSFRIEIQGAGADAILNPALLQRIADFQDWLEGLPEVASTESLANFAKRAHQVMTDGQPKSAIIPNDQTLLKQMLLIAGPEEMYRHVDLLFSKTDIEVWTPIIDSVPLSALIDIIEARIEKDLAGVDVRLAGNAIELVDTVAHLTGGQMRSLGIGSFVIFLMIAALLSSWRAAALSMLPNLLPVAAYFAVLGFTDTPLGPTTALVACIVLGIAVDDTLHLMARFNQEARISANEVRAAQSALTQVIRPITLSTAVIAGGFLLLATSPFDSQAKFGLFAALTLIFAWACDLIVAPAVASRTSIVTLWDLVRLDLGQDPQRNLPLMDGLSPRQAKILALSTEIREVPAGEVLLRQGEVGDCMYLVIQGCFEVSAITPDDTRIDLAVLERGKTIGEAGFFQGHRTATAVATTASRVLVLTPQAMERLTTRYPRIAALTYRNINRIQAERLDVSNTRLLNLVGKPLNARTAETV